MQKTRIFLLLSALVFAVLLMTSCSLFDFGTETTEALTTTKAPIPETTVTKAPITTALPVTTTVPVTTEPPRPATEGLLIESNKDGTAKVVGIQNAEASEIVIPEYTENGDRVIEIAPGAFSQNRVLTSVFLPKNVYVIGANAFFGCDKLTLISFSEGLEFINISAFSGCTALESLNLPSTVTDVQPSAFSGCTALKFLTVAEGSKTYRHEGNCLIRKSDNTVVLGCSGSKIPKSVKAIGDQAFYNMGITEVLMPDSVLTVGNQAFGMNAALSTLVLSESLTTLGDLAFYRCTALTSLYLPESLVTIGMTPFRGCSAMERLTISANNPNYRVESLCLIEKSSDTLVQGFGKSEIPASVKIIGKGAFNMMPIASVTLPVGCTVVEAEAFANTYALYTVTLPRTLTSIHVTAFRYATVLTSLHFEGSEEEFKALTEGITFPEKTEITFGS